MLYCDVTYGKGNIGDIKVKTAILVLISKGKPY